MWGDLHVVQKGEYGRFHPDLDGVTAEARFLESCPEAIYGFEFRDAYLHVPVSHDLRTVIASRVGRDRSTERGGRIWVLT